ncbi:hypothetical protein F4677DRAFT_458619 [Hypoxylon crocopeplum]|nr:hypothetical protein F4677DRAFT_458619 [Hypoxylon crocopeplum]
MCKGRRVFWACFHEDYNYTPPRKIFYCFDAKRNKDGTRSPCTDGILPLTGETDYFSGIVRDERCAECTDDAPSSLFSEETATDNTSSSLFGDATRHVSSSLFSGTPSNDAPSSLFGDETPHVSQGRTGSQRGDAFTFNWDTSELFKDTSDSATGSGSIGLGIFTSSSSAGLGSSSSDIRYPPAMSGRDFQLFDDEDEDDDLKDGELSWMKSFISKGKGK